MEQMEKNKVKKSSLLMRFKPCAIADSVLPAAIMPKRNARDPVLSYIAVADKDGAVLPAMLSSILEAAAANCGGECGCRGPRNEKGKDRWHTLRTVMNGTTLMRKIISRKRASKENMSMSKSTNNLDETISQISIPKCKTTRLTTSALSSASGYSPSSSLISSASSSPALTDQVSTSSSTHETCSSMSSSTPFNNGTCARKQNQCAVEDRKKGQYGSNIALLYCMLLISLLVLVLWGRLPAIMCTSFWLYIVHPRRTKPCNVGGLIGESEVDNYVQDNKKIFLERKLERTRSRVSFNSRMYFASNGSMPKS